MEDTVKVTKDQGCRRSPCCRRVARIVIAGRRHYPSASLPLLLLMATHPCYQIAFPNRCWARKSPRVVAFCFCRPWRRHPRRIHLNRNLVHWPCVIFHAVAFSDLPLLPLSLRWHVSNNHAITIVLTTAALHCRADRNMLLLSSPKVSQAAAASPAPVATVPPVDTLGTILRRRCCLAATMRDPQASGARRWNKILFLATACSRNQSNKTLYNTVVLN